MVQIDVQSDQRVLITGMTGSGKTFLARQLLRGVNRLVVLDPKGMLRDADDEPPDETWNLTEWSESGVKKLMGGDPVRMRVAAPLNGDWSEYLWAVYKAGNVVLYIDEMYGVVPIGKRAPDALTAIYTRGRELGIGAIGATQRPVWVPLEIISESEWLFIFRLRLDDDRRRMASLTGPEIMNPVPDRFGFWTYNVLWDSPIYTPQLEIARPQRRARSA